MNNRNEGKIQKEKRPMKHVGMDLHQKTTTFGVVDEAGNGAAKGVVPSNKEGWEPILQRYPK